VVFCLQEVGRELIKERNVVGGSVATYYIAEAGYARMVGCWLQVEKG